VRKKPYDFTTISPGVAVAYRRCRSAGRWVLRCADGSGGVWTKAIGLADDFEPSDGEHVLTWHQAQDRARKLARGQNETSAGRPATIDEAIDGYASDLKARGGDVSNADRARHHLPPTLLSKPVSLLTARGLRRWRDGLIETGTKPATINRTLKAVKACLNLAAAHDPHITNREAWRVALAGLPDTHRARDAILTDDEVRAVIAAAWRLDRPFGLLIEVAALTGARMSQLARIEVGDLQADRADPRLMMPSSRKGRGRKRVERRPLPIPASLAAKLRKAAGKRPAGEALLLKSDGSPWRPERSEQREPFARIAAEVGLAGQTMYALRHSSIVRALLASVPIRIVGAHHDTSVAMIEKTYSRYITDHADSITRAALLDPAQPAAGNVVPLRKG
jgi:integrase